MRLWGTSFAHAFLLTPRRASPPTPDATKPHISGQKCRVRCSREHKTSLTTAPPTPNATEPRISGQKCRVRCSPCLRTHPTTAPPTPHATKPRISGQKCRVRCSREQKTSLTTAPTTPHATKPRISEQKCRVRCSRGHFAKVSHLLSGCERPGRHHPHCWTAQCIGLPQQRQREHSPWRTTSRRT